MLIPGVSLNEYRGSLTSIRARLILSRALIVFYLPKAQRWVTPKASLIK